MQFLCELFKKFVMGRSYMQHISNGFLARRDLGPKEQGRRSGFGMGGGGGKKIGGITLTYKKDTILYMSISVISKINWAMCLI